MAGQNQRADAAPISFRLERPDGLVETHTLVIRPEELTRNSPSLQTPVMTLDGAFMDAFGRGLETIQISGHTGWGAGNQPNGAEQFFDLHQKIWNNWHDGRKFAVSQGMDPALTRLIFIDTLNRQCVLVAPGQFVLKRSKTRPLLYQYQINMTVLNRKVTLPAVDPLTISHTGLAASILAGIDSLRATVAEIRQAADNVHAWIDATIVAPVRAFMVLTADIMDSVIGLVDDVAGIVSSTAGQLIGLAGDLAQAGRNIFWTVNAVAALPDFIAINVDAVAAAYENAMCIMRNALRVQDVYPDYTGLYGASNCSSTIGGSPLSLYANTNPWETFAPTVQPVASVTPAARSSLNALVNMDPILQPKTLAELGTRAGAVALGSSALAA